MPTVTSPTLRVLLPATLLLVLSLADLALTVHALRDVPGATELNPLADHMLTDSLLAATFYKLVGLEVALILSLFLVRAGWPRAIEYTLLSWCGVYLLLNVRSLTLILGGA